MIKIRKNKPKYFVYDDYDPCDVGDPPTIAIWRKCFLGFYIKAIDFGDMYVKGISKSEQLDHMKIQYDKVYRICHLLNILSK